MPYRSPLLRRPQLRSRACMCCGAWGAIAVVEAGAIDTASTGTPPSRVFLTGFMHRPDPPARLVELSPPRPPDPDARRGAKLRAGGLDRQPRATRIAPGPLAKSIFFVRSRPRPESDKAETTPAGVCIAAHVRGSSGKSSMVREIVSSARSRWARSWVAITLVRSNAPPGGTAGWIATLV